MGCCVSSSSSYSDQSRRQKPTAEVVSLNGELRSYPLPVTASQVIHFEALSPDSSFVCNSDRLERVYVCLTRLYCDDYVPCLDPEDELEPAQIYFVLPVSKLRHRLAAADMASLAVKASVAINASNPRRTRRARISPVLDSQSNSNTGPVQSRRASKASAKPELGVSRSGSVRKVQRNGSRRAKSAVRSFRLNLTTINEGVQC